MVGKEETQSSGEDKTAIIVSIQNRAGALLDILGCFSARDINMTRIISRPSTDKKWDYLFFIDVLGHKEDENLKQALQEVQQKAAFYKLLGSFPISPL